MLLKAVDFDMTFKHGTIVTSRGFDFFQPPTYSSQQASMSAAMRTASSFLGLGRAVGEAEVMCNAVG